MEHTHHKMLSVWFFVGVLLLTYGVIILTVGLLDYHQPSSVILARYHAPVWGGLLLIVVGLLFTIFSWPRRDHHGRRP
jgi:hypothetical protein